MNTFQIALVFAMVVGVAFAGTCKEDCDKVVCQQNLERCNSVGEDSQICDNDFKGCSGECDEACSCIEPCAAKCTPDFDKCINDNADNSVLQEECRITFANCDNDCQLFCNGGRAQQYDGKEEKSYN